MNKYRKKWIIFQYSITISRNRVCRTQAETIAGVSRKQNSTAPENTQQQMACLVSALNLSSLSLSLCGLHNTLSSYPLAMENIAFLWCHIYNAAPEANLHTAAQIFPSTDFLPTQILGI